MSGYMMSEIRTAVSLYGDGAMVKDIAENLGRSRHAVRSMLNYAGIKRPPGARPKKREAVQPRHDPIGVCPAKAAMDRDAFSGSAMLLEAIQAAGVRP